MKKLLTSTALLLIALASVSYGQDVVICSPSGLGPDIVAELGICPRGYIEVRRTANSSGNSSGGLFQRSIENMSDSIRRDNERRADEREATRQRQHERELLEMQLEAQRSSSQNTNNTPRNGSLGFERWEVTMETPQGNLPVNLTAHNDCSLTFSSPELGDARVTGVSRSFNTLSFQSIVEAGAGQSLTLYFDIDINRDRLTGQIKSDLGGFTLQGRRVSGTGNVPQQCITTRSTRNVAAEDRDVEPEAQERASSLVKDLTNLGELHEQGILTDEEFNAAKRRLLGL